MIITSIRNKKFEESDYITKGRYFEKLDERLGIDSSLLIGWKLLTKQQAENIEKPLTKELVAQTLVNYMIFRTTYNIDIKDINNCYDKQAIVDAVGMGIFELDNGKFNPNQYMTEADVEKAIEKMVEIENEGEFDNKHFDIELQDGVIDMTEVPIIN